MGIIINEDMARIDSQERGHTVKEAAAILGVHPNTVRKRIVSGAVKAYTVIGRFGEEYRLPDESIEALRALLAAKPLKLVTNKTKREDMAHIVSGLQVALEQSQARIGDAQRERDEWRERADILQARVEQMKSLTVWDYLRGKHRSI